MEILDSDLQKAFENLTIVHNNEHLLGIPKEL